MCLFVCVCLVTLRTQYYSNRHKELTVSLDKDKTRLAFCPKVVNVIFKRDGKVHGKKYSGLFFFFLFF